jgi:hypothetical protein
MYQFSLKPYYDNVRQCYKQIITVFPKPEGKLANIAKQLHPTRITTFRDYSDCDPYPRCFYAVTDPRNRCDLLRVEDITLLLNFLAKNGYVVDNQITKTLMRANTPVGENLLFYVKLKEN